MKKTSIFVVLIFCLSIISCKKDDGRSCTTCSSSETAEFQVCEESNGDASVNGQDTGTPYNIYLSGLQEAGADCN